MAKPEPRQPYISIPAEFIKPMRRLQAVCFLATAEALLKDASDKGNDRI